MGIYGDLLKLNEAKPQKSAAVPVPASNAAILPVQQPIKAKKRETKQRDTVTPRHHATVIPRHHDTSIQIIRTSVKQFGKEAATHRFTLDEKKAIADLVYTYKKEGIKTSENEISRIGVNFLIEDYKANDQNSILNRALRALNS